MIPANLRTDVFRHAAELIDSGRQYYACHALSAAVAVGIAYPTAERNAFAALYRADALALGYDSCAYFSKSGDYGQEACRQERAHRILALLLSAEIAEDENRRARQRRNSAAYRARGYWRKLRAGEIIRRGDEYNFSGDWFTTSFVGKKAVAGCYRRRAGKARK